MIKTTNLKGGKFKLVNEKKEEIKKQKLILLIITQKFLVKVKNLKKLLIKRNQFFLKSFVKTEHLQLRFLLSA